MVEFYASGRAHNRGKAWNSFDSRSMSTPAPRSPRRNQAVSPQSRTRIHTPVMLLYLRTVRARLRDRSLRVLGALMSLNDPQWGRRPNQGPPDLDEIWRDFNRKLGGMFGRRGGGGGEEPPGPDSRKIGGGAGLLLALVL